MKNTQMVSADRALLREEPAREDARESAASTMAEGHNGQVTTAPSRATTDRPGPAPEVNRLAFRRSPWKGRTGQPSGPSKGQYRWRGARGR